MCKRFSLTPIVLPRLPYGTFVVEVLFCFSFLVNYKGINRINGMVK